MSKYPKTGKTKNLNEEKIREKINADFQTNFKQCQLDIYAVTNFNGKSESWKLCKLENNNRIIIIESHKDSTNYEEVYFETNGELIYAKETKDYVLSESTWNCEFYVKNKKIISIISLGMGKTESDEWEPESIFKMYSDRLLELKRIKLNSKKDTNTIKEQEQSCNAGYSKGCSNLGMIYIKGIGVKKNYLKALKFYTKACDGDEVEGCFYTGVIHTNGLGVKQSYFNGAKFYKKACDGGHAMGCTNLGVLHEAGLGVRQSYFNAKKFYGKACDGGNEIGCNAYSILNRR